MLELKKEQKSFIDKDGRQVQYWSLYVEIVYGGSIQKIAVSPKTSLERKVIVENLK